MKKIMALFIFASLLMTGCASGSMGNDVPPNSVAGKAEYEKITQEEAKKIMESGREVTILDVRTQEEYDEGHIKGAVLLPDDQIQEMAEELLPDKEAEVLVYCRTGRRSAAAAKELIGMGYTNVKDFGGIVDWPYEVVSD